MKDRVTTNHQIPISNSYRQLTSITAKALCLNVVRAPQVRDDTL